MFSAILILILLLVMIYSGLQILESTVFFGQEEEQPVATKTIHREEGDYFPKQDMTVILVMGIDEEGPVASSNSYRNTGEVDMAALVVLDQTEETVRILCLNRDTMLSMPVLGLGGRQAGSFYGQLALSHTYGSGLEDSAENTRQTISDFLYGLHVDYYVAMHMDAIPILNDAVGGVTVNVTEDFSEVDATIGMGQQTLMGQQSIHFVRTRKDVGDQLNVSRIRRQEEYIRSFADAFREKQMENSNFVVSVYEDTAQYIVTDCSVNAISGLAQRCSEYELLEITAPEGENIMGEEYYEFYADEEALDELILDLFYAPKE